MKENEKTEKLRKIKEEVFKCRKCDLYKERIKNNFFPVIGEGNHNAKIIFCGEAPGLNEAKTGRPFCGEAGIVLDNLLSYINLKREDIYICNLLKCRPPGNRDPRKEEIRACSPYLSSQIEIINPLVIITLGRFSMARYFQKARISKIHGKATWHDGHLIIPMYHPAAALHQPKLRSVIMQDFAQLKDLIEKEKERRITASKEIEQSDDATQLSFF